VKKIGFRQARTFLAVAESSSVTGAAKTINRSQTSVTKTLQDLERELGVELFDRSSRGVTLTAFGKALQQSLREAADAFERAGGLVPPVTMQESPSVARFFQMDVSDKWLDAFLSIAEHQNLAAAASELNVTSAAVSANLRKIEDALSTMLFERLPNAMIPTTFARSLLHHIKLARTHLRHACDVLAGMQGVKTGRITVGSLPFMRALILPRAIASVRRSHPYLDVSTVEGPYDDLTTALRCGDIDFLLGALRGLDKNHDLVEESLLEDRLSLIVRAGHPLQHRRPLDWPDLLDYEWVLPQRGTPTRRLFEAALRAHDLQNPPHVIETSSMSLLRGLLVESDMVTVLSRHQIVYDEMYGMLIALPLELGKTRRQIGITRRRHGSMALAADVLIGEVRTVAGEIAPSL